MADAERVSLQSAANPSVSSDAEEDGELVADDDLLTSELEHEESPLPRTSSFQSLRDGPSPSSVPAAPTLRPGDTLAQRYHVERVLGRDGNEMVVFVRHLDLGQRAVLRYLLPEACALPDAVARFQRSARRAQQNHSEHTEHVIDFGRLSGGNPYRVSELPRGPSLDEVLRVRGELPVEEAVDTAITLCEALAEVHVSRDIFRNLSPSNVFIERRPDGAPLAKLVQLGAGEWLETDILDGNELALPGTASLTSSLPYAAPERFRNPGGVGPASDIWAVGAIVHELLTGAPLFQADSTLVLIAMIAADPIVPPSAFRDDVPEELDDIVLRCLAKDPLERPQTAAELVELLLPFSTENVHGTAERVRRIVQRTTRPPMSSNSIRATAPPPSFGRSPLASTPPRGSERPSARVPPPLSRSSRAAPPRASVRPSSFLVVGPTTIGERARSTRSRWGLVAVGAFIGAIAAVVVASLRGSPAAPIAATDSNPASAPAAVAAVAPPRTAEPGASTTPASRVAPPVARPIEPALRRAPRKSSQPSEETERETSPQATAVETETTASNKAGALFGGMD